MSNLLDLQELSTGERFVNQATNELKHDSKYIQFLNAA